MRWPMGRRYLAELVGTFGIVFAPVAYLASGAQASRPTGLLEAALISGLAVVAMIAAFGPVSAAHFNPAVTLGFAAAKRFPGRYVLPYVSSQLLGAAMAGGLAAYLFGAGPGAHVPTSNDILRCLTLEAVITMLLMLVIMAMATDKRSAPGLPPMAIGLTVVVGVLAAGVVTGGSMNPARSLGPALFAGSPAIGVVWLYILGPSIGGVAGALLFERLRIAPEEACNAPELDS